MILASACSKRVCACVCVRGSKGKKERKERERGRSGGKRDAGDAFVNLGRRATESVDGLAKMN